MKFGMRFGNPFGCVDPQNIYVAIDQDVPEARTLSWTAERTSGVVHHVIIDDVQYCVTGEVSLDNFPQDARDHIEIIETSPQNADEDVTEFTSSPNEYVKLTWAEATGTPDYYEVYRKLGAGSYALIATIDAGESSYELWDGPLDDGTYTWKLVAYDAAGNEKDSNEESETIDAAPDPPTNLAVSVAYSWIILTWTASGSGDLASYNVYRGFNTEIELSAAAHDTATGTTWQERQVGTTGHFEFLLRAVDAAGNEEDGLGAMVQVDLDKGAIVERPNAPTTLLAEAIAAGQIRVQAGYDRGGEVGTATSIRIYVNDGAGGAMDWSTPVGTGTLATGLDHQTIEIDSSGLTGGLTYNVGIRARTDGGTESDNTDVTAVTTDATAPGAPVLTTDIV